MKDTIKAIILAVLTVGVLATASLAAVEMDFPEHDMTVIVENPTPNPEKVPNAP